ncbi:MAG: hypothetical protein ACPGU5_06425 [Lishizhenia sp.]
MKKLLFLFAILGVTYTSMACRCAPLEALTKQEVNEATNLFIGKIRAVDTLVNTQQVAVLISVKETIKGEKVKERTVKTNLSSAACGLTLKLGQEWFFFITEYKGELRVNMCGRHLNVTKPRFRWCKKKRGSIALDKAQYKNNLKSIEAYKQFIVALREER